MGDRHVGQGDTPGPPRILTMPALVTVERLSIRRGAREVLRALTFTVDPGDFLAIVGPNGAGKTTLLSSVLGLLRPSAGCVRILGRPVQEFSRRDLARLVSYVPQADARPISFSVEEFVLLGRYAHRGRLAPPDALDRRAIGDAMEATATTAFRERQVSSLSGGERQRVFIAAALAQHARVLLLDEPTAFLDPRHHIETADLLRGLNGAQGLSVMMVTHDVNLAARCGRQILALRDGTLAYFGDVAGFLTAPVLATLYGVSFEVLRNSAGEAWAVARGGR
jgi:ABC-type cobalamin/Fe3+-siderophores transport system ATPase subunit